jgi:PAS domain S-box-containing protein
MNATISFREQAGDARAEYGGSQTSPCAGEHGFGALFELSPDAILIIDPYDASVRWPIVACNDAACRITGYAREELIGQPFDILHVAQSLPTRLALYEERLRGEQRLKDETIHRRKDGTLIPIECLMALIPFDGRELILSIERDIGDRQRAEEALQQARDELEFRVALRTAELSEMNLQLQDAVAEQERVAVELRQSEQRYRSQTETLETINRINQLLSAELDLQKLVQAVTDAATELSGAAFGAFFYNLRNEQGESYTLYTLSGVPTTAFAGFPMPRNTKVFGPTFRGEGVIRSDDVTQDPRYGQNQPYAGMPPGHLPVKSYLAVPVVSRDGEVLGGLFFGHPERGVFTEREERILVGLAAQTAIAMDNARLYQAAQTAIRARDEFVSVAAHELKTPVTSILGFAQLLLRRAERHNALDDRAMQTLRTIAGQAARLNRLMGGMLDLSRLEMGQLTLERGVVDLGALADRVVAEMRLALNHHAIAWRAPDAPVRVDGDELRLEQVLQNLLRNAIKYSPAGGTITLEVAAQGDQARVAVSDEGIGIPEAALPRLFSRFYRADNAGQAQISGLGLGLYVVKEIVTLHGGRIDVTSKEGQGSAFIVELPLYRSRRSDEV